MEQYAWIVWLALGIALIDIDRFKQINDAHGHVAGDEALEQVARCLESATRSSDIVGRFGGDEFLILLPRTRKEEASGIARRILDALPMLNIDNSYEAISVSMGITEHQPGEDLRGTIKKADDAMFQAKRSGGNQFEF